MNPLKLLLTIVSGLLVIACTLKDPLLLTANEEGDYGLGGTGIVGSVTGFGSIFVNGVEVEISDQTRLSVDGRQVDDYSYAIGETVEILAANNASHTTALQLNVRHEIIGPVSSWDDKTNSMQILGQRIQVPENSGPWSIDQMVKVSGFRDELGAIYARHVETSEDNTVLIRGMAEQISSQVSLAGYAIADKSLLQNTEGLIQLRGQLQQGSLDIQHIQAQSAVPYQQVRHWKIEGFVNQYREHWPGLSSQFGSAQSRQPVQFELNIDEQGGISVRSLDTGSLRRGAQQSRAAATRGFGSQGGRQNGAGSGGGKGHK